MLAVLSLPSDIFLFRFFTAQSVCVCQQAAANQLALHLIGNIFVFPPVHFSGLRKYALKDRF
jgi:hypothetical protein